MNARVLIKESGRRSPRPSGDPGELLAGLLAPVALPALRILMGLVFIWFGALKVAGVSPVKALVSGTLPWIDADLVVPALGAVEVLLGIALLAGVGLRLVLPLVAAHLAGTFLTFVMLPGMMFRHDDPLLLTADGEFVLKNLVLISAALVLLAHGSSVGGTRTAATRGRPALAPVPGDPSV